MLALSSLHRKATALLRGVLFDLDGTLLQIDLESFLSEYFAALGPVVASLMPDGGSSDVALAAVVDATNAMCGHHPGVTNCDVFNATFAEKTGVDLTGSDAVEAIERFYREVFPGLQGRHGPRDGAVEAVETAAAKGFELILATNPIFPRAAIVERLRWAGFAPARFRAITTYENMHACKPASGYYRQAADLAGVKPSECLMVGDDPILDASAADVGMRVFYVGLQPAPPVDWAGSLSDLTSLLERLESPTRP